VCDGLVERWGDTRTAEAHWSTGDRSRTSQVVTDWSHTETGDAQLSTRECNSLLIGYSL